MHAHTTLSREQQLYEHRVLLTKPLFLSLPEFGIRMAGPSAYYHGSSFDHIVSDFRDGEFGCHVKT